MATHKERIEARLGLSGPPPALTSGEPPQIPDHQMLRCIGLGSYGEVWLARNVVGQYRAVKVVYRDRFSDRRPYEREFSGIQKYEPLSRTHQGLVQVLQIGRKDVEGYFYYVMELADDAASKEAAGWRTDDVGGKHCSIFQASSSPPESRSHPPLFDPDSYVARSLQRDLQLQERLPVEDCVQLGLSLNLALGHLHRHGLIHRDVKPSNIIFVSGVAKLADIGLVTEYIGADSFVGTEGFIPPEGPNSPQADLYGLGKVLYEASMGKDRQDFPEPFTALREHADSQALLELNAVLLKACATNIQDRYQSAEEMHVDLALLQSGDSVRQKQALERRLARLKRVSTIGAAVTLVVSAALLWQRHETQHMRKLTAESRNVAYAADMALAQEALRANNLGRAQAILDRERPSAGQQDLRGFEWRYLWSLCQGNELHTFHDHSNSVTAVAISPDAKLLATASFDKTVRVWDLKTHNPVLVLANGHTGAGHPESASFSPDGRWLAAAYGDGVVVWEVKNWRCLRFLAAAVPQNGPWATSLVFSSDSRLLVCRLETGVMVWETATWQPSADSIGGQSRTYGNVLALDSKRRLLEANGDLWDLDSRAKIAKLPLRSEINAMAFSPDGKIVATGHSDGLVTLRDMGSLHQFCQWKAHANWASCLAFTPDGRILATGGGDELIQLWDVQNPPFATAATATPKCISTLRGHRDQVWSLALSPDGRSLVSGSQDGNVKLWSVEPTPPARPFTNGVHWIWLLPDGGTIIGLLPNGRLGAWGVSTGEPTPSVRLPKAIEGLLRTVEFLPPQQEVSPDGRCLLQAITNGLLRVWSLSEGIGAGMIRANDPSISSLFFSADSRHFVTTSTNGTARVWDVATKTEVDQFEGAFNARLSPDGRYVAARLEIDEGIVCLRDVLNHRDVGLLKGHRRSVSDLVFSPQGDLLATASADATVRLWHIPSGRFIGALEGHTTGVEAVAFAPDGKTIVTAANYDSIKFWQVATRQEMLSFPESSRFPVPVVFSANGTTLAVASGSEEGADKIVKFWRAPSWEEIAAAEKNGDARFDR